MESAERQGAVSADAPQLRPGALDDGSLLLATLVWHDDDGRCLRTCAPLTAEHFETPERQTLFEAVHVADKYRGVDVWPVLVADALGARPGWDKNRAQRVVADLYDVAWSFPDSAWTFKRVKRLHDRSLRITLGLRTAGVGGQLSAEHPDKYPTREAADELVDAAEEARSGIAIGIEEEPNVGAALDELKEAAPGETGWKDSGFLDIRPGFEAAGSYVLLGGRTSTGKSTLALNLALRHLERAESGAVVYWSCEMTARQLTTRARAAVSGVPEDKWDQERKAGDLAAADAKIKGWSRQLFIYGPESGPFELHRIVGKTHELHRSRSVSMVIVDYAQKVKVAGNRWSSLNDELTEVSTQLQTLCRTLRCTLVAPVQLNRSVEKREGPPRLSDIRDCGAFEQDADQVWLLSLEDSTGVDMDRLTVDRAKMRSGKKASALLHWNLNACRLLDAQPQILEAITL